jgi:hypothetical protein
MFWQLVDADKIKLGEHDNISIDEVEQAHEALTAFAYARHKDRLNRGKK